MKLLISLIFISILSILPGKLVDNISPIKLSNYINTSSHEYMPVPSPDGNVLYFAGMDRTGYFDFKLDFTKQKNSGGEDIFYSSKSKSGWNDARPITELNTNGHEVITCVPQKDYFVLTANYPEKLGPLNGSKGLETTDLFIVQNQESYRIQHLPEPVNSIYTEADGFMDDKMNFILFVSDRPGNIGDYHKKGWKWNDSFWGNTDIYVSLLSNGNWSIPINLGKRVNSPFAERTPRLSRDGLTLYLSSNGYHNDKSRKDLDIYYFKRKSVSSWTNWEGPFTMSGLNSKYDDWGYIEDYNNKRIFFARSAPSGTTSTQPGASGDGGIRETNLRTGYVVTGLQLASLKKDQNTEIYISEY